MENFIVSARKYRPATFDTVVGQQAITQTLKNAIQSGQLAQSFLFCGPRGVGKTTCARIMAKTINCTNPTENMEACGSCESCTSFKNASSYNIYELDAASNNSVEDIRNLVEQVRIPPQGGKYKIYIIDEVHMLSTAAFNAFLKTLEEPPAYAKFILATTEKHKIIPTILSRCQIFDFKRITIDDMANHLAKIAEKENVEAEKDALHIIAQKADGALRDALSMFDQLVSFTGGKLTYQNVIDNLNVLDYDYYFRIIDAALAGNISEMLLIFNEIMELGFDGQHFLTGLGEHLRNLLVCQDASTVKLLETSDNIKQKYLNQAQSSGLVFLIKALEINNQCDINYKNSNNKRLSIEVALMQIASLQIATTAVAAVEKKTDVVIENKEKPTNNQPIAKKEEAASPVEPIPSTENSSPNTENSEVEKVAVVLEEPVIPTKVEKEETAIAPAVIKKSATPSLKDLQEKNGSSKNTAPAKDAPCDPISQEDAEAAWIEFCQVIEEKDPSSFSTFCQYKPSLKEGRIFFVEVPNKITHDDMLKQKGLLFPFLKKRLNNHFIELEVFINPSSKVDIAYTPDEKYKKMLDANPALKNFKDQLGLDVDF